MEEKLKQAGDIIFSIVSDEPCRHDHHGYCQEHSWFRSNGTCPHKVAQDWLKTNRPELLDELFKYQTQ